MRTINEIIGTEVYTNISQLICNVVMANSGYQTEFLDEAVNMTDWDLVIEQIEQETDEDAISEWLKDMGLERLEDADHSDLRDFAYENDVYVGDCDHEIMEYWVVSDWLHGILTDIGYPVSEFQGLAIMCRTTTGQSLSMDYVWHLVRKEMLRRYTETVGYCELSNQELYEA